MPRPSTFLYKRPVSFLSGIARVLLPMLLLGIGLEACRGEGACSKQEDCVAGTYCVEYFCKVLSCPKERPHLCNLRCTNMQKDANHCGACGKACPFGEVCISGGCRSGVGCTVDSSLCNNVCTELYKDAKNCGQCGFACAVGYRCKDSKCVLDCGDGDVCDGKCAAIKTDRNNCGSCGKKCTRTELCKAGVCEDACGTTLALCGETCVDFNTDKAHCGACNRACQDQETCVGGRCLCQENARRACYDGPTTTKGIGSCKEGYRTCRGGNWSECVDQILPVLEVQGDQVDNDCDGKVDETPSRTIKTWIGAAGLLSTPSGVAYDDDEGVLYVSSTSTHRIYKLYQNGQLSLFAGSTAGKTNATGAGARFTNPAALALDAQKNLYVADYGNHCIRKVTPKGAAGFFAGGVLIGAADGQGTKASFFHPFYLSFSQNGELFVTQDSNTNPPDSHLLRRITPDGTVSTLATFAFGRKDGSLTEAKFQYLRGIALSPDMRFLIAADSGNDLLRRLTFADGQVTTFAGSGVKGRIDGVAFAAQFWSPQSVVFDGSGDLYVSDTGNHAIRKVAPDGRTVTLAGNGRGWQDGLGSDAKFYNPAQITLDRNGNLYVADSANNAIRKVAPDGTTSTLYREINNASHEKLLRPGAIAIDSLGRLFIPDVEAHGIFVVGPQGDLLEWSGHNGSGYTDGKLNAAFNAPSAVAIDAQDNLYVADEGNHCIRKIEKDGNVTTFAGTNTEGFADGTRQQARFSAPSGLAFDANGNLYIADKNNHRIRKIDTNGNVTTLAGDGTPAHKDGLGTNAQLRAPNALAFDANGDLFVADTGNHRIRKIDTSGNVTTFAGNGNGIWRDGSPTEASFFGPSGILSMPNGDLLVADTQSRRIRRIDPQGNVTTFAGNGSQNFNAGPVENTGLSGPYAIARDKIGRIYLSDRQTIRIIE